VVLHFGNQSPWFSANKVIDYLVAWLILTIGLPDLLTLLTGLKVVMFCCLEFCDYFKRIAT